MRNLILIAFLSVSFISNGQSDVLDEDITAMPLGAKYSLKLSTQDSISFTYEIIDVEEFKEIVVFSETEKLFGEPKNGEIEVFFVIGQPEPNAHYSEFQSLLLLRNNINLPLTYKAEILTTNSEEFENTSVLPLFPGVRATEMWPYKIELIALHTFSLMEGK